MALLITRPVPNRWRIRDQTRRDKPPMAAGTSMVGFPTSKYALVLTNSRPNLTMEVEHSAPWSYLLQTWSVAQFGVGNLNVEVPAALGGSSRGVWSRILKLFGTGQAVKEGSA